MTTYENMFGIDHHSASALNSAFTSTGAPLAGSAPGPLDTPQGHAGHGHKHKHGGFLKTWSKLLGIDAFVETATGRGAAAGGKNKKNKKRNPYSKGCMTNCKDFWCDPAPVFGKRETGIGMLGGRQVNWTEIYESPALMDNGGGRRGRGGYESVAAEEV